MNKGEWVSHFCVLPRRVESRLVWWRIVWKRNWYFGCIAGSWSGTEYRLAMPSGVPVDRADTKCPEPPMMPSGGKT